MSICSAAASSACAARLAESSGAIRTRPRPATNRRFQGLRVVLPYVDDYLDFSSAASVRHLVERFEAARPLSGRTGRASIGRRLTAIREGTSDEYQEL
jgi:hypothetical protein